MTVSRHRKREREFQHWGGIMVGMTFMYLIVMTVAFLFNYPLIAVTCFACMFVASPIAHAIIKGENAMMEAIKQALGLNVINMKLEALANHFKLRFKHVPEHYECEARDE